MEGTGFVPHLLLSPSVSWNLVRSRGTPLSFSLDDPVTSSPQGPTVGTSHQDLIFLSPVVHGFLTENPFSSLLPSVSPFTPTPLGLMDPRICVTLLRMSGRLPVRPKFIRHVMRPTLVSGTGRPLGTWGASSKHWRLFYETERPEGKIHFTSIRIMSGFSQQHCKFTRLSTCRESRHGPDITRGLCVVDEYVTPPTPPPTSTLSSVVSNTSTTT